MKRSTILLTALAVLLYLGAVPLLAQGHHGPGTHGPLTTRHGNKDIAGGGKSTETASQTQLNKVISSNPPTKLASKLESLLGINGTVNGLSPMQQLQMDAAGFKSLGRFVSAAHAYNRLGLATKTPPVSFTDFAKYDQAHSLGAAIKHFDPTADPKTETRNATKQANQDIKESESES